MKYSQSPVEQKKCEIRSTSKKVLLSHSNPLKVSTVRDFRQFYTLIGNILAPRGCCTPRFLHVVENDQVLLAHPHRGQSSPLQFF